MHNSHTWILIQELRLCPLVKDIKSPLIDAIIFFDRWKEMMGSEPSIYQLIAQRLEQWKRIMQAKSLCDSYSKLESSSVESLCKDDASQGKKNKKNMRERNLEDGRTIP